MTRTPNPEQDWKVWQSPAVAVAFANDRRGGILGAEEQLVVLQQLLPERATISDQTTVLDIGCGDGVLLATVLAAWQGAQGVALDGSPTMLALAQKRFADQTAPPVRYVETDFNHPDWRNALPFSAYDAIVSGFAIHHSEDDRKKSLYAEIFNLLKPGGVFINLEHVASASTRGETLFERAYARNLTRKRQAQGAETSYEATLQELQDRLDKSANRLALAETQTEWLREIGYQDADCYWKYYELAILAGYRPIS